MTTVIIGGIKMSVIDKKQILLIVLNIIDKIIDYVIAILDKDGGNVDA